MSGLYAQTLAERGFLTIAFDPSFYGESGGEPRYLTSPEISVDDFSAAVDYLVTNPEVDLERVGILGICGWGGFALAAASNDPRIKATVTSTMYDMCRVIANGYFDAMNAYDRYKLKKNRNDQRTEDYRNETYAVDGGIIDPVPEDAHTFVKRYHDFYKTSRGYQKRSPNSNNGKLRTVALGFLSHPLLSYISEIRNPVMIIHDSKAHSLYFSKDAYQQLTGDNKELVIIDAADHTDLYDNLEKIPFDRIIVGSPTWWYKMAQAVLTFLSSNDFSGKEVVPFMTNAGWPGTVIKDMTAEAKRHGAKVSNAHEFRFSSNSAHYGKMETPESELTQWINQLKNQQ